MSQEKKPSENVCTDPFYKPCVLFFSIGCNGCPVFKPNSSMLDTKRKLEANRKKLLAAIDLLWMSIIIGDVEKFDLRKTVNRDIDNRINHLKKNSN